MSEKTKPASEVTKTKTAIKQEPYSLSDLKHDSAPSAARAQPQASALSQVSLINADVSCAIFVDLCYHCARIDQVFISTTLRPMPSSRTSMTFSSSSSSTAANTVPSVTGPSRLSLPRGRHSDLRDRPTSSQPGSSHSKASRRPISSPTTASLSRNSKPRARRQRRDSGTDNSAISQDLLLQLVAALASIFWFIGPRNEALMQQQTLPATDDFVAPTTEPSSPNCNEEQRSVNTPTAEIMCRSGQVTNAMQCGDQIFREIAQFRDQAGLPRPEGPRQSLRSGSRSDSFRGPGQGGCTEIFYAL